MKKKRDGEGKGRRKKKRKQGKMAEMRERWTELSYSGEQRLG